MKGQQQALSAILITGVLMGVVGSVYFWGLPLIQKNKDISVLENSEGFMLNLNNKIKNIANHGGRETMEVTVPGIIEFDGDNITLEIETTGSIYAENAPISLSKNGCSRTDGTWGVHNPEVLCLLTQCLGEGSDCGTYQTVYTLRYIQLNTEGLESYKIDLVGNRLFAGENDVIQIENKGTSLIGNLKNTEIEISII